MIQRYAHQCISMSGRANLGCSLLHNWEIFLNNKVALWIVICLEIISICCKHREHSNLLSALWQKYCQGTFNLIHVTQTANYATSTYFSWLECNKQLCAWISGWLWSTRTWCYRQWGGGARPRHHWYRQLGGDARLKSVWIYYFMKNLSPLFS